MTAYGIDLGTTFTSVATVIPTEGVPRTQVINITDSDKDTLESVVFVESDGGRLRASVGREARSAHDGVLADDDGGAGHFFQATKRDIGLRGSRTWPVKVGGRAFTPEHVAALILRKIKQEVSATQPAPVERVVITHPHYFTEPQKAATREAGRLAKLDVIETLNEPTAAALAYGVLDQGAEGRYLVFDLGGGTLDVTLMEFGGGRIKVVRGGGNARLGGVDWDRALLEYFGRKFAEKYPEFELYSPETSPIVQAEWRRLATEMKIKLSRDVIARVPLKATFSDGATGQMRLDVTREQFEDITRDLVQRCRQLSDDVLANGEQGGGIKWTELREVLLVGGSTKLPAVRRMIRDALGRDAKIEGFDPNTLVAQGAAYFAARVLEDAALRRAVGADAPAAAEEPRPAKKSKKSGLGLPSLQDATARGIGIGIFDDRGEEIVDGLVPKSTATPHRVVRTYYTQEPNQREIRATLYEGESADPSNCAAMGECVLTDLPPGPAGQPVEVSFDISSSGRATVFVKHLKSGRQVEQEIQRGARRSSAQQDPEWLWTDIEVV